VAEALTFGRGPRFTLADRLAGSGIAPIRTTVPALVELATGGFEHWVAPAGAFPVMSAERRSTVVVVGADGWRVGAQGTAPLPLLDSALLTLFPRQWPEKADVRQQAADAVFADFLSEDQYLAVATAADEPADWLASLAASLDEELWGLPVEEPDRLPGLPPRGRGA
jgi:hypothetical protein